MHTGLVLWSTLYPLHRQLSVAALQRHADAWAQRPQGSLTAAMGATALRWASHTAAFNAPVRQVLGNGTEGCLYISMRQLWPRHTAAAALALAAVRQRDHEPTTSWVGHLTCGMAVGRSCDDAAHQALLGRPTVFPLVSSRRIRPRLLLAGATAVLLGAAGICGTLLDLAANSLSLTTQALLAGGGALLGCGVGLVLWQQQQRLARQAAQLACPATSPPAKTPQPSWPELPDDPAWDALCKQQGYLCPIGLMLMQDPVQAPDGHTYERSNIACWLRRKGTSPLTRRKMTVRQLIPNRALRERIAQAQDHWAAARPDAKPQP